jgi:hypothetical protein
MRKTSISDITSNAANGYQGDRRLSQFRYRKPGGAELSQFEYNLGKVVKAPLAIFISVK